MNNHIENNYWPCKEKGCSWCCDPIKIPFKKWYNIANFPIPEDENKNPLWIALPEIWIPEKHIDSIRIQIYECLFYDKTNWICKNYEKRPDICRKTSCINEFSLENENEQYQNNINTTFIKVKK